jgi:hypothetical protein
MSRRGEPERHSNPSFPISLPTPDRLIQQPSALTSGPSAAIRIQTVPTLAPPPTPGVQRRPRIDSPIASIEGPLPTEGVQEY